MSIFKKYGFAWVTLGFVIVSLTGHWLFGYVNEQQALHAPGTTEGYLVEILRDTFENWQSEFLQLLWQVIGLSALLYVGFSQSKDNDERSEAKLDAILRKVDPRARIRLSPTLTGSIRRADSDR